MSTRARRARVEDVHVLAQTMPHVTVERGPSGNPVYQVGGKSFVFFRTPRPDAVDPDTGERYIDVIVFWVPSESDKQALVQDQTTPFFTTPHFDGHRSVLLRASRIAELSVRELTEIVQDAWLSRGTSAYHDEYPLLMVYRSWEVGTGHGERPFDPTATRHSLAPDAP